jgi:hypothetical protein
MADSIIIHEAKDLISDGLVGAAVDLLEEFVKEQPYNSEALQLISRAYLIMGQQNLAASFLRRSLRAKQSAKVLPAAGQFGTGDAEYYDESTKHQPEYAAGQEYELADDTIDGAAFPSDFGEVFESSTIEVPNLDFGDADWLFDEFSGDSPEVEGWETIILDDQFVDIDDEQIDYEEVEYQGRLTPRQRARQIVGELATEFELEEDLFDGLIDVLVFHKCHGQTKKALRALLEEDVSAEELALVFDLRAYWTNYEGFARIYFGDSASVGYINLSWSLGVAVVRCLGAEDAEEAILFIEDCFEDWACSPRLISGFSSFRSYMLHIVEHMVSASPDGLPAYIDYQYFQDDESLAADFPGGAIYKWLEENNLLYQEPVPY